MFAKKRNGRGVHILKVSLLVTVLALFAVPGLIYAQTAIEADATIDVVLNGKVFADRGVVFGDRTYVALADVAESIEGRLTYEPVSNVAFIQTGDYLDFNVDGMRRLNPKFRRYYQEVEALDELDAVQYVAIPGAFLGLLFSPGGELLAFNELIPAAMFDHEPWFDQQEGDPMFPELDGGMYMQHLYVVDPSLVRSAADDHELTIALNGYPLDLDGDSIGWLDGELYVKLRDVAKASGGGVGWNAATRTASAKIVPGYSLYVAFLYLWNDSLEHYGYLDEFVPGAGHYFSVPGPGISFTVSGDGRIASFVSMLDPEMVFWQPWFDQAEDQPESFSIGERYTIHHYVMPLNEVVQ